jgi:phosphoribosylformylglycinamidine cyclo-ligase
VANIQRILPDVLEPALDFSWEVPWIFNEIQNRGNVSTVEMRNVFNLGIGMVLAVSSAGSADFEERAEAAGIKTIKIGMTVKRGTRSER